MDDLRGALASTVGELKEIDRRRAEVVARRDRLMVQAMSRGMTWREVGELTGLSVGAVRKSVNRVRAD